MPIILASFETVHPNVAAKWTTGCVPAHRGGTIRTSSATRCTTCRKKTKGEVRRSAATWHCAHAAHVHMETYQTPSESPSTNLLRRRLQRQCREFRNPSRRAPYSFRSQLPGLVASRLLTRYLDTPEMKSESEALGGGLPLPRHSLPHITCLWSMVASAAYEPPPPHPPSSARTQAAANSK